MLHRLAGGSEANSLPPAPEFVFVVVISAGTLFSTHGSKDVPHILLADITRMNTNITHCFGCTTALTPVFNHHPTKVQFNDALGVLLLGGYGMFYDDLVGPELQILLCKQCALKLCDLFPRLKALIPSDYLDSIQDIET